MEVLFVAHRAPFPPDKGDRLRAWRHLTRLATLGPVDLVAQADSEEDADTARKGLAELCREVHVFPRRKLEALAQVGLALTTGRSLTVGWHTDARVERALRDLQSRHQYDLCWSFSSGTGPWLESRNAGPRIMDLCDVDALKWEALAKDASGPRSWIYALEARRLLPLEVALAETADACLVSTKQEAEDILDRGQPRRLEVLTNGSPWEQFVDVPAPSEAEPVVGFLGQMDYPPNIAAVKHLALDVLPIIRQSVPSARLRIMGRAPTDEVRALSREGEVEVTGAVDSIPEALSGIRVFCAPLDRGRGIPNKILEALSAGRATVVSSWAAKALDGVVGEHYLVADGAEERSRVLADLLADPGRCDELGAAGRLYVKQHHDWGDVLDRLESLVREVARA
jgi:sugar transferase (PEP-CTERM/EpsH1 system associated)